METPIQPAKTSTVSVRHLALRLPKGADRALALVDLSFELPKGEVLCIVGESGSGKSLCAQTLMGLLPRTIKVERGEALFDAVDLISIDAGTMRSLRGRRIGMIFQEPMTALNPSMRIEDQIMEVFEAHDLLSPAERRARALELAREVQLPDPERTIRAFPHQLSGGQRQRAMIAMALALEPALLIADEPTTALDVTTQAQILKLMREIQQRRGMSVIFITHDLGVVADIADHVLVLEKGIVVEQGRTQAVLGNPQHPYTRALIAAVPSGTPALRPVAADQPVALAVENLNKSYGQKAGMFGDRRVVHAVRNVSFEIRRGETLGVVGESGSGKSSVARLVTLINAPDSGHIYLGGEDFSAMRGEKLRQQRSRIQMVFQDPFASLNPRRMVGLSIADGPIARGVPKRLALDNARALLELVGLDGKSAERLPHEFSGGQRQRIGIARALALEPDVLVADEAVSALDVTVQAQVLKLLEELKSRLNLAMLFITHDLHVAAQVCDRMAVMRAGEIVEIGTTRDIFLNPQHDYTRQLLAAIPGSARQH
ncbi:ABC transporter ATP-binding protein [Devosia beringensis]|uniref:ABC transporter ATP-binding protein n=1 Tax=Devosia beringensis TaxID=2657486 RepID=UPI00186B6F83|nr:ABC transporter ATP-binding protein [Devosia beringensis]